MSNQHIDKLQVGQGGGKANGLTLLKKFGFKIPETFVITAYDEKGIDVFVSSLPGDKSYAIRSSASVEDGSENSYAGQFLSLLDISGGSSVIAAIKACFESAHSKNVETYNKEQGISGDFQMNVIVQEMVDACCSGVIFTADPVNQRHDMMSISVTPGIGEELMAGHEEGENHLFFKHQDELPGSKLLNKKQFRALTEQAKAIEAKYGKPADLEWAMNKDGHIQWLQLRPVTSLTEVHQNELDHIPTKKNLIYTRGNIGEMMPGPVTPLTLSTFARAIEVGLQVFYQKIGALKESSDENFFVHSFYNHLFFDMEKLYDSTRNVLLSKKENIDFAIVGAIIPGQEVKLKTGFPRGLMNLISMTRYINTAPKAWLQLKELHDSFKFDLLDDAVEFHKLIDQKMQVLFDAYSLHYVTSSQSGALYSTILNIHSKNKVPQNHHQEKVAKLFGNIPDVESVNVLKSIDELAILLAECEDIRHEFLDVKNDESLHYLTKKAQPGIRQKWNAFIERHGHRCVREAELYEKEWAAEPTPVIEGLKTKTRFLVDGFKKKPNGYASRPVSLHENGLSWFKKKLVGYLLPKARKAVARREQTKAWSIGIQYQFKKAYRHLARLMVEKGLLDDEELIFFMTHQEIGELLSLEETKSYNEKAKARKKLYPEMQRLSFPDLSFGIPVPETETDSKAKHSGNLVGIPVSQGIVEGKVRLVNNLEEARKLEKNEIMVAKFTDIGWTPYYSVISGLITEIGSPLSHGAVVAREYGLPAVVSMKGAMAILKTGQQIKLDAVKGEVIVIK